jgi:hypothetical protein
MGEREIWLDNETSDWILNMERCCWCWTSSTSL